MRKQIALLVLMLACASTAVLGQTKYYLEVSRCNACQWSVREWQRAANAVIEGMFEYSTKQETQ